MSSTFFGGTDFPVPDDKRKKREARVRRQQRGGPRHVHPAILAHGKRFLSACYQRKKASRAPSSARGGGCINEQKEVLGRAKKGFCRTFLRKRKSATFPREEIGEKGKKGTALASPCGTPEGGKKISPALPHCCARMQRDVSPTLEKKLPKVLKSGPREKIPSRGVLPYGGNCRKNSCLPLRACEKIFVKPVQPAGSRKSQGEGKNSFCRSIYYDQKGGGEGKASRKQKPPGVETNLKEETPAKQF